MDSLTTPAVEALLHTGRFGRPCIVLATCASTNDEIARLGREGHAEGTVVAADEQSAGRGRRGRTWHSPRGDNLYCSLLLRPPIPPDRATPLTLLAGLALAESLEALGFSPRLKWPNDLLLESEGKLRKVAGVLMELSCQGTKINHLVLGVGINVGTTRFPPDLAEVAISLRLASDDPPSRSTVLARFLNHFEPIYDEFLASGPREGLAAYRRFAMLGQPCFVDREGNRTEGVAADIDDTGALLMCTPDGSRIPIHAGEVNWVRTM